ncbi:MAG TPA: hypothetical protein VMV47_10180 [Bacteroidales bacterium]|nr:hypothetical protein [Bacteroidales bacterium]
MKIDRSNYETWFIDLLDGNLNEIQTEQLNIFLSENPDLSEELNELNELKLMPPDIEYAGKTSLNKSFSDISDNQYDYLCVACIENDLSEEEITEFSEIVTADPERKYVLELFRLIRLSPPDIIYKNKKKLIRITPIQRVIRLSVASLSAAATVSILVLSWLFVSQNNKDTSGNISHEIVNEEKTVNSANQEKIQIAALPEKHIDSKSPVYQTVAVNKLTAANENEITEGMSVEVQISRQNNMIPITYVQPHTNILMLNSHDNHGDLVRLRLSIPEESQDHWAIRRYIAKTFREKILKEETNDESPIRGYEIAEAGVTGINKLMGWQMAFVKNSNDNGEVKSVYFSSKILKIQAPVNNQVSEE